MRLDKYIKGDRRGKEANLLERKAMNDPFLQEALEGFDAVSGNHAEAIGRLERKVEVVVRNDKKSNRRTFAYWSGAASILLLVGFGAYFLFERNEPEKSTIAIIPAIENEGSINNESFNLQAELLADEEIEESAKIIVIIAENNAAIQEQKSPLLTDKATSSSASRTRAIQQTAIPSVNAIVVESDLNLFSQKEVEQLEIISAVENEAELIAEEVQLLSESVVIGFIPEKKSTSVGTETSISAMQSDTTPKAKSMPFGKKEFQEYCLQKVDKNACAGKKVVVKMSFLIDTSCKPTQIKFGNVTCEKAKEEIEKLLSTSPAWTTVNKKISMTIRW